MTIVFPQANDSYEWPSSAMSPTSDSYKGPSSAMSPTSILRPSSSDAPRCPILSERSLRQAYHTDAPAAVPVSALTTCSGTKIMPSQATARRCSDPCLGSKSLPTGLYGSGQLHWGREGRRRRRTPVSRHGSACSPSVRRWARTGGEKKRVPRSFRQGLRREIRESFLLKESASSVSILKDDKF